MTLEELRSICLSLGNIKEDIKWEDHLCFNIGDKMFLVTSPDSLPVTASFKASDEDFSELTNRPGFIPAPYLARYKWVFVDDINRLSVEEWTNYIRKSYDLVYSRLPTKIQKQLLSK